MDPDMTQDPPSHDNHHQSANLSLLPPELLLEIISYLYNHRDLRSLVLTSRRLHHTTLPILNAVKSKAKSARRCQFVTWPGGQWVTLTKRESSRGFSYNLMCRDASSAEALYWVLKHPEAAGFVTYLSLKMGFGCRREDPDREFRLYAGLALDEDNGGQHVHLQHGISEQEQVEEGAEQDPVEQANNDLAGLMIGYSDGSPSDTYLINQYDLPGEVPLSSLTEENHGFAGLDDGVSPEVNFTGDPEPDPPSFMDAFHMLHPTISPSPPSSNNGGQANSDDGMDFPGWSVEQVQDWLQLKPAVNSLLDFTFNGKSRLADADGIPTLYFTKPLTTGIVARPGDNFPGPSLTNIYGAALLHNKCLPNLFILQIDLGGPGGRAGELVESLLIDSTNLPLLRFLRILNTSETTSYPQVSSCVLPHLFTRRRMISIEILCLADSQRTMDTVCELEEGSSSVENLQLTVPDALHQPVLRWLWPGYTQLLTLIRASRCWESLHIHEPRVNNQTPAHEEWLAMGKFASGLGDILRKRSLHTLRSLVLSGTNLKGFQMYPNDLNTVTAFDPVADKTMTFHNTGGSLGSLRGVDNLTTMTVQLWHILGRDYLHPTETALLTSSPKTSTVTPRVKFISQLLPPNLQSLTLMPEVSGAYPRTSSEKETMRAAVRQILLNTPRCLRNLRRVYAPKWVVMTVGEPVEGVGHRQYEFSELARGAGVDLIYQAGWYCG